MTTHRLRYLQSLRQLLPESTAPFDIVLHKKSPSDQLIPHLAVQCGDSHVHALSESLATILTGNRSALYIPRFVFAQMSGEEAAELFQTHDKHVKSLRWLSLSPMLSNLDRTRKEYNPDGTSIERTTREWAHNIKASDGKFAQCDVVNGGTDQKCYLLFTPQHEQAANMALEEYRKRLYPFTQQEARFRSDIGPPPTVHLSKHVIANIDFMKKLSSNPPSASPLPIDQASNGASSADSFISGTTVSSVSQATTPMTPRESPPQQNRQNNPEVDDSEDDRTTASTETAPSKVSAGRLSASAAKLRDLDAMIQRQKTINDQKEAKQSERVSHLERQISRLDELDAKLDEVKADFGQRLNLFEDRMIDTVKNHIESSNLTMDSMNSNISKLMSVVNKLVDTREREALSQHGQDDDTSQAPASRYPLSTTNEGDGFDNKTSSSQSHASSSRSAMSEESSGLIQSPEHKRMRSGRKEGKDSVRRRLDNALADVQDTHIIDILHQQDSFDSLDRAVQDMDAITNEASQTTNLTTDLESQYNSKSSTEDQNSLSNGTSSQASVSSK